MLVVSERRASACLIMLSAKVATGTIVNAFGMARPGFEPTTSRSRSGRSIICAIGTGFCNGYHEGVDGAVKLLLNLVIYC